MPSASMAEPAVAPDLECSGCGNPIIKDGQFKCLRCRPKRAVPATLGRRDIVCPRHRQPVVLMRYDRKSGQYRAHCQKSGCLNHDSKTGTIVLPTEEMMTQKTEQTVVEHPPAGGSKTQELRDWLDREIFRSVEDVRILTLALQGVDTPHNIVDLNTYKARYFGLTSDERERKIREDRKKLEELKARLEKLKSARALDVDLDALEESLRTVRQSSWRDDIIRSQRPWSVRLDLKNELIEGENFDSSIVFGFRILERKLNVFIRIKERMLCDSMFKGCQGINTGTGYVHFLFPGCRVAFRTQDQMSVIYQE